MVERGPEKAGVGGSIPSLATTSFGSRVSAAVRSRLWPPLHSDHASARRFDPVSGHHFIRITRQRGGSIPSLATTSFGSRVSAAVRSRLWPPLHSDHASARRFDPVSGHHFIRITRQRGGSIPSLATTSFGSRVSAAVRSRLWPPLHSDHASARRFDPVSGHHFIRITRQRGGSIPSLATTSFGSRVSAAVRSRLWPPLHSDHASARRFDPVSGTTSFGSRVSAAVRSRLWPPLHSDHASARRFDRVSGHHFIRITRQRGGSIPSLATTSFTLQIKATFFLDGSLRTAMSVQLCRRGGRAVYSRSSM